ncbi:MAG: PepSY-associated TM helix domain-containing protein [Planctomycetota bacterium]
MDKPSQAKSKRRRTLYQKSAAAFRWFHIYLSMLGFTTLMFFALTGITLNHPSWLGGSVQTTQDFTGDLDVSLLQGDVDRLDIAETLRERHGLRGRVKEFEIDEYECMLVFKGPGYAADAFIDREAGSYMVTVTSSNWVAVMNDLHKGRDSGTVWKWVIIDGSAILLALFSISGFGLLFYLKRRRVPGVWTAVAGTIALIVAWVAFVP